VNSVDLLSENAWTESVTHIREIATVPTSRLSLPRLLSVLKPELTRFVMRGDMTGLLYDMPAG
jgi:hypothetical protein